MHDPLFERYEELIFENLGLRGELAKRPAVPTV